MLEFIANWIIGIISSTGYIGIFILMTIESACIPLPSEITMPFAGFLVSQGKLDLVTTAMVGGLGNLFGSLIAYFIGFYGQEIFVQKLIRKWGKYFLITMEDYTKSERWFRKYGEIIVFISRLLPAIRTFISLPAGIAKMKIRKFIIYTFIGSFFWSLFLTYVGMVLGQNWGILGNYFHKFDIILAIFLVFAVLLYIRHKLHKSHLES